MKKLFLLTSIIALAACGGGGGGGGGSSVGGTTVSAAAHVKEIRAAFDMGANPTVQNSNTSVTGMASYTVQTPADEDAILNYVSSQLGDDVYSAENYSSLLVRSASRARISTTPLGDGPEDVAKKKAIAAAKIANMKQVLYDMVNADSAEEYVHDNRESVHEALVLFDKLDKDADISGMTDAELAAMAAVTKDNVMSTFADFDHDNFGFTKETIENVVFRGTGDESMFKFRVDLDGKITDVALFEDPTSDYDDDDGNKFVYTAAHPDPDEPETIIPSTLTRTARTSADEAYRVSNEGWFSRVGTSKNFGNTHYEYSIDLGDHNLGNNYTSVSDFRGVKIYSDNPNLSGDDLKQAILDYILARGNKHYSSQGTSEDKTKFATVVKWYADKVAEYDTDTLNGIASSHKRTIVSQATLDGVGRDVGLQYADFGYATLTESSGNQTETLYTPYAGGYDARNIAVLPEEDMVFNGKVVAAIEHSKRADDSDLPKQDMLVRGDGELRYSVTGTKHTLVATNLKDVSNSNNDWYNITIEKNGASDPTFVFDGTNKNIPTDYQFFTAALDTNDDMVITPNSQVLVENQVIKTDGVAQNAISGAGDYRVDGGVDLQYYGPDSSTVTEATARFGYSEEWHDAGNHNTNEVAVYGAFGGKR